MNNPPCLECKYREIRCHSKCNSYKRYKEHLNKIKKNRNEERRKNGYAF